jgi:hypothetical protein
MSTALPGEVSVVFSYCFCSTVVFSPVASAFPFFSPHPAVARDKNTTGTSNRTTSFRVTIAPFSLYSFIGSGISSLKFISDRISKLGGLKRHDGGADTVGFGSGVAASPSSARTPRVANDLPAERLV